MFHLLNSPGRVHHTAHITLRARMESLNHAKDIALIHSTTTYLPNTSHVLCTDSLRRCSCALLFYKNGETTRISMSSQYQDLMSPATEQVMSDCVPLWPIQCCKRILECIFCSTQSFLLHVRSAGTRKQPRGGGKAVSKASTPSPYRDTFSSHPLTSMLIVPSSFRTTNIHHAALS